MRTPETSNITCVLSDLSENSVACAASAYRQNNNNNNKHCFIGLQAEADVVDIKRLHIEVIQTSLASTFDTLPLSPQITTKIP